jgi:hypothetical protein
MRRSHTPLTRFPQSIGLAWEQIPPAMDPYPTSFPPPRPHPPSHLLLPMGSTPAIAPDDHFPPPATANPKELSRSTSPHQTALTSIVFTLSLFLLPSRALLNASYRCTHPTHRVTTPCLSPVHPCLRHLPQRPYPRLPFSPS